MTNVLNSFTVPEILRANADLSYTLGKYYGFPNCCIVEFCADIINNKNAALRNIDGSGFIPCSDHYAQIKSKIITLDSLIDKHASFYCKEGEIEFANWILKEEWYAENGFWYDNPFSPPTQELTTDQLYELFLKSK